MGLMWWKSITGWSTGFRGAEWGLLVALAWLSAQVVVSTLAPVSAIGISSSVAHVAAPPSGAQVAVKLDRLLTWTPFGAAHVAPTPSAVQAPVDIRPTSLPLKLQGVITGKRPLAIIEETAKRWQEPYGVGAVVAGATVIEITARQVKLQVPGGGIQILTLEDEEGGKLVSTTPVLDVVQPARAAADGSTTLARADIQSALANINQLMVQARIMPHFTDGQADGFTLSAIQPGSFYQRLGLHNGDVVHRVNGRELSSPEQAVMVYQQLQGESDVEVEVTRNGQPTTLHFAIR
ncbi:MAG: hypothetical protein COX57_02670 [Alphaproteobacteria bacterium CG_4_10_14_0_2_um_filter_63_37]|nr:MAG: hypothetical protein AUJ55_10355 [Proteobacteria bacterium CG1_02_64_396]PJA25581.1 MAG: hypothetical protein COX57_02670 [Alphaproteobacteria bacterium CG_4_10_14_0_2_um_filter_63_37]